MPYKYLEGKCDNAMNYKGFAKLFRCVVKNPISLNNPQKTILKPYTPIIEGAQIHALP